MPRSHLLELILRSYRGRFHKVTNHPQGHQNNLPFPGFRRAGVWQPVLLLPLAAGALQTGVQVRRNHEALGGENCLVCQIFKFVLDTADWRSFSRLYDCCIVSPTSVLTVFLTVVPRFLPDTVAEMSYHCLSRFWHWQTPVLLRVALQKDCQRKPKQTQVGM